MIDVRCVQCEFPFQVEDQSSGGSEFCPNCGALNDIPNDIEEEDDATAVEPVPMDAPPPPSRGGIPAVLWWLVVLMAAAGFVLAAIYLMVGNWETRHLQELADAAGSADASMDAGNYADAEKEYRTILDTVGQRQVQSVYLNQLIDHARQGAQEADTRLHAPPPATAPTVATATTQPTTQPAPAAAAAVVDEEAIQLDAMRRFQRCTEIFDAYIRARPQLFVDERGNYRRRRFIVLDITYETKQEAATTVILHYTLTSRTTGPHDSSDAAQKDSDFPLIERPQGLHCVTTLLMQKDGRWEILDDEIDPSTPDTVISGGKIQPRAEGGLSYFRRLELKLFDTGPGAATQPG